MTANKPEVLAYHVNKDILKDPEIKEILEALSAKGLTPKMIYTAMNKMAERKREEETVADANSDYKIDPATGYCRADEDWFFDMDGSGR